MKVLYFQIFLIAILLTGCNFSDSDSETTPVNQSDFSQYITILGIAQDAGYPQMGCKKECCQVFYKGKESKKHVSCIGLVDRYSKQKWLFDATPDIKAQLHMLSEGSFESSEPVHGIFLTHAHMGHYTGLVQFGREALGANNVPVYAMPRMKSYLENNGPWSQLVNLKNIDINPIFNDSVIRINKSLSVTPILVPHRDEYSETVGYRIQGVKKSVLFIPDIDKWETWEFDIIEEVKKVDYAFLDASFFADGELDRDMSKIPHPFITQTTTLFEKEALPIKNKIHFIHFNHTNPAIKDSHHLKDSIRNLGFNFSKEGDVFEL